MDVNEEYVNGLSKKIIYITIIFIILIFAVALIAFDFNLEENNPEYLVDEHDGLIQASIISKLVPVYGTHYFSNYDSWFNSTVNETPSKIYDTNGMLFQYLFTVLNETQKLGVIAIAANKSLGMPVMAIDDGPYDYYLHYYNEYDHEKSIRELLEYTKINHIDITSPEIKEITYDLFTVSPGIWLDKNKSGNNVIINRNGQIYNLSLTVWNNTNPVGENYDWRYISERSNEWEEINAVFQETYGKLISNGINPSMPLSYEERKYFIEFAENNTELYNASNRGRPFTLPPVYPEEKSVSKIFHEHKRITDSNYLCMHVFFDSDISNEEIINELKNSIDDFQNVSPKIQIHSDPDCWYTNIPVSYFNEIRTDLILNSPPFFHYRIFKENISIFYSSDMKDISPLIYGKYGFTNTKIAEIWFKPKTRKLYIDKQWKNFDSNEKVRLVTGFKS